MTVRQLILELQSLSHVQESEVVFDLAIRDEDGSCISASVDLIDTPDEDGSPSPVYLGSSDLAGKDGRLWNLKTGKGSDQ